MPDPVVITRPLAQAGALAARIEAIGRSVELLPLLDIAALVDAAPLKATDECAHAGIGHQSMITTASEKSR